MRWWWWSALTLGALSTLLLVAALSVRRSRSVLIELIRLIPACLTLLRDIIRDPLVPRRAKLAPALALAYLAMPIDVIPDFIPGIGQFDDVVVVAWAIRHLIARAGRDRVAAHWKGDPDTLERILRLARVRALPSA